MNLDIKELSLCHKLWFSISIIVAQHEFCKIIKVWNINGLHHQGAKI